ncbi:MAG TPA: hypothetical protein VLR92_07985, partial [Blastocatellia bacterium]|nr:hypothetical protein [Blastocatellia bacterium]
YRRLEYMSSHICAGLKFIFWEERNKPVWLLVHLKSGSELYAARETRRQARRLIPEKTILRFALSAGEDACVPSKMSRAF